VGDIKNGKIAIPAHKFFNLEGELPFYAAIALRDVQMRVEMRPDAGLLGYIGGYLNWQDFAYMLTTRPADGAPTIGIYHALKKMADAYPDPKTGRNTHISATFRFEALPAYLAN